MLPDRVANPGPLTYELLILLNAPGVLHFMKGGRGCYLEHDQPRALLSGTIYARGGFQYERKHQVILLTLKAPSRL